MLRVADVSTIDAKSGFKGVPPLGTPSLGTEIHKLKNIIKAIFDFSVSGGALGNVALLDDLGRPAYLPSGAIVVRTWAYVIAAVTTSAGGTLGLTAESASDMVAQTAVASLGLNAVVEGVLDGAASKFVRMTALRQLTAKIGTGALTAGKVAFFVEYVLT